MAENTQRSTGRPGNYKMDRGGTAAEFGPFTGIVMSTVDPTRSGRLRVYIEAFADGGPEAMQDDSKWTTVSYMSPFFGASPTPQSGTDGNGTFPGNQTSYGMWFTPPDVGGTVVCIFVNGDRSQGFYIGSIPEQGLGNMVPAIPSSSRFEMGNKSQEGYLGKASRLPTTEINTNNEGVFNDPRYFESVKPVHGYLAQAFFQQGIVEDLERGTIRSGGQRETPSTVFGINTPGIPIYQGGMKPNDIRKKLSEGTVRPNEAQVIGRVGGHSFVMDDGDLEGDNALVRLRTTKGHQITMSDSGNFFYIIHANGQTWLEFGVEGTVDIFSTNSINLRSNGDINLHADRDLNMYAGRNVKLKSKDDMQIESAKGMIIDAQTDITVYSKAKVGIKADGTLTLNSNGGSWGAGDALRLKAGGLDLNGPAADVVSAPNPITKTTMDDTSFSSSTGWKVNTGGLESIVSRAPTHEPYPYHNKGVDSTVAFEQGPPSPPPGAVPVPPGVEIQAK
jgi:hypothetical protein